jgi:cysteine desulfurase/selenocysteine lyase
MMQDYSRDFGPFDGKVWLNCAHQGPLPRIAVAEAHRAILLKTAPYHLQDELFSDVPRRLKRVLGKLIGVPEEDIILGNSASYGLHLLANGIPWQTGDEVLVVRGDFPADVLPWLGLEKKGVRVRRIQTRMQVLQAEELEAQVTNSTRLLCLTWVHSFNGHAIDLAGLGEICRARGVTFVLNCSQALGTRPLDLAKVAVDAITCVGFKWLCGPYGTGFCWIRPDVRESLDYNQAYWLSVLTAEDLAKEQADVGLRSDLGARRYDVFGTANFFNFMPWTAAVEYLLEKGIERIEAHNNELVSRLIDGLAAQSYALVSPREGTTRSTLVIASHQDASRNSENYEALRRGGVYVAFRAGKLRFSPHLYNTNDEIDHVLSILRSANAKKCRQS